MFRNTFFMFISTVMRFVSGALLMVLLARCWGPDTFGFFMYPFVLAGMVIILIDYGFNLQLVRDVGHSPEDVHELTCRALALKTILTALVAVFGVLALLTVRAFTEYRLLIVLLVAADIINSYGMLFSLSFRGMGFFQKESLIVFWSNLFAFLIIGALALFGFGPYVVALAFVLAKLFFLVYSWLIYQRHLDWPRFIYPSLQNIFRSLRIGFPYAAHVALGTLYFQVDTLILERFLGAESVGIYQAGLRIMIGGLILGDIFSNVYLSRMASADRNDMIVLASRMTRHCLMVGSLGLICMSGLAEFAVNFIYGGASGYKSVIALFPFLGIVLFLRYLGASYGLVLTVDNRQVARMIAVGVSVVISVALNLAMIPRFGLSGVVYASIGTHLFLTAIYIIYVNCRMRNWFLDRRSFGVIGATIMVLSLLFWVQPENQIVRMIIVASAALLIGCVGFTPSELGCLAGKLLRLQINRS